MNPTSLIEASQPPARETVDALLAALPPSVVVYIALLIVTYVLHAIFMQYTIGGALWTLWAAVRGRFSSSAGRGGAHGGVHDRASLVVRDWLPSAVSGAITAGIAPLLFVQIVYQKSFYTANLLLFNRWMMLLPALIVAIYALYVVKAHPSTGSASTGMLSRLFERRSVKSLAAAVALALIAYTGLAFVENHLLSLMPASWPAIYGGTARGPSASSIALRFAMWIFAALPMFAVLTLWQLRLGAGSSAKDVSTPAEDHATRPLALLALVGMAITFALAFVVWHRAHGENGLLHSRIALGALIALFAAQVLTIPCWLVMATRRSTSAPLLWLVLVAQTLAVVANAVLREAHRLASLAGTEAAPREPAPVGGLVVFLIFTLIGVGAIVWIVRAVAKALRNGASQPT